MVGSCFPKSVRIVNPRLTLIFWLLWAAFFTGGMVNFILSRKHTIKEDISNRFTIEALVEIPEFASLQENVAHAMNRSDFCTTPRKYDYWWDSSGVWTYENYTCRPMCPENKYGPDCVSVHEVASRNGPLGEITFVTSVQDRVTSSPASNTHGWHSGNYWVKAVDYFGLGFQYSYETIKRAPFGEGSQSQSGLFGNVFSAERVFRSSIDTLVTVVLDVEGRLWKVLPPNYHVLWLKEILELVGNANMLDEPNELMASPNQLHRDGVLEGNPPVRLTGAWIDLQLGCYTGSNPNLYGVDLGDLPVAKLCTIKPRRIPRAWVQQATHLDRFGNGDSLYRINHGLTITISPSGEFEYLDFNRMFLNLIAILVLLGYPAKIVCFLAQTCFGQLSKIYERALVEEFDIMKQVAGTAARLSTCTWIYKTMMRVNAGVSVTSRTLQIPLQTLLCEEKGMDDDQIDAMARFCTSEMSKLGVDSHRLSKIQHHLGMDRVLSEISEMRGSRGRPTEPSINVVQFSAAYCQQDAVDLRALANLFDKSRNVSILERCFTPLTLWRSVRNAHGANHDELAVTDGTSGTSSIEVEVQTDDHPQVVRGRDAMGAIDNPRLNTDKLEERLLRSEMRLEESEREMMKWSEVVASLSGKLSAMETRLRDLERVSSWPAQNSDNVENIYSAVSMSDAPCEETLSSRFPTSGVVDELKGCMAILEQRLANVAIDVGILKSTQVSAESHMNSVMGQVALPEGVTQLPALEKRVSNLEGRLVGIDDDSSNWELRNVARNRDWEQIGPSTASLQSVWT